MGLPHVCLLLTQLPHNILQDLRDLVRKLLVVSPARRLGAARNGATGVKEHGWFREFDWEAFARKKMKAPYLPVVRCAPDARLNGTLAAR